MQILHLLISLLVADAVYENFTEFALDSIKTVIIK